MQQDDISISLEKNDVIDLAKTAPSLTKVRVALGWDETKDGTGQDFDLDAMAFACSTTSGSPRLLGNAFFVYYNHLTSADGAIVHMGDNLTGAGDAGADKEQIIVDLQRVHPDVSEIAFFVNIFDAAVRRHQFGMVRNAFIRLVDDATGKQIARYNLTDDFGDKTIVQFGSLYKDGAGWAFKALGVGFKRELMDVLRAYGARV